MVIQVHIEKKDNRHIAFADIPTPYGPTRVAIMLPARMLGENVGGYDDDVGFRFIRRAVNRIVKKTSFVRKFMKQAVNFAADMGLPVKAPLEALRLAHDIARGKVKAKQFAGRLLKAAMAGDPKAQAAYKLLHAVNKHVPIVKMVKAATPVAALLPVPGLAPALQAVNVASKYV